MKKYLMLGIVAVLLAVSVTTVFAGKGKNKDSGWYCYYDESGNLLDEDYYEKATSGRKKDIITTYTFFEDNIEYQPLGQEQFHDGENFYDDYTKNDVTLGEFKEFC